MSREPRFSVRNRAAGVFLLIVLFFFSEGIVQIASGEENGSRFPRLEVSGYYQTELAYRYLQNAAFSKFLHLFQMELRSEISDSLRITAIGRATYNAIYGLESFQDVNPLRTEFNRTPAEIAAFLPQRVTSELREFYADANFHAADFRVGKQIVRWGIIEGFRITDEVNPLDFGEFILREVGDRYIPLWMVKSDVYMSNMSLEILFIPDLTFHQPAQPGTEWEEFQIPPGTQNPSNTPENWEWGLRLSKNIRGWDSAVSYLYAWDDFPAAFRTSFATGVTTPFTPHYTRTHSLGFNTSRNIEGAVVGVEADYVLGKYFETGVDTNGNGVLDSGDAFSEVSKDYLKYGLLLDYNWHDIDFTTQFSQSIIFHYDPIVMEDQVSNGASFFVRREWLNGRLNTQTGILYFFNHNEALIRPRVDFKITDTLRVSGGADIFSGSNSVDLNTSFNFIGFFRGHDRLYTELRYSF